MSVTPLGALGEGSGEHLDQLDTLRAFAVTAVLIRHFWPELQPGLDLGARGVHLFFVLSGFLITGILLRSRALVEDSGRGTGLAIRRFYIRRFLRIFPIYYLVLAVTWALGFPDVRSGIVWHLAYGSNILFAIENQWPPTTAHLWSLSVEEQFYLIWPLLMLLVPRRHLRTVIACLRTHRPAVPNGWIPWWTQLDRLADPVTGFLRQPRCGRLVGLDLHPTFS